MPEHHEITGAAHGAPLAAPHVGARVRVPLDAPPTPRWSRAFAAHLVTGLVGHPAVGHLRLDGVVQGADIVLDGVEPAEAEHLGPVLVHAVETANRACRTDDAAGTALSMEPAQAEQVAHAVSGSAGLS